MSFWDADLYSKNSQFQFDQAIEVLKYYSFKGDEDILDIGCGDGKITAHVAQQLVEGKVIGVDNSKEMIDFALRRFSRIRNCSFQIGAAEEINFKDEFDFIYSFAALHWVRDLFAALKKIREALKEKGVVIITVYPRHPLVWNAINRTVKDQRWADYFNNYSNPHVHYTLEQYKRISMKANLKILRIKKSTPIVFFDKRKKAKEFILSCFPYTERIPKELKLYFIGNLLDNLIMLFNGDLDSARIGIPFKRINAYMTK